jgi:hypothetical protein
MMHTLVEGLRGTKHILILLEERSTGSALKVQGQVFSGTSLPIFSSQPSWPVIRICEKTPKLLLDNVALCSFTFCTPYSSSRSRKTQPRMDACSPSYADETPNKDDLLGLCLDPSERKYTASMCERFQSCDRTRWVIFCPDVVVRSLLVVAKVLCRRHEIWDLRFDNNSSPPSGHVPARLGLFLGQLKDNLSNVWHSRDDTSVLYTMKRTHFPLCLLHRDRSQILLRSNK